MSAANYVLAIDEGSSSTRAVIFDAEGRTVAENSAPVTPTFVRREWVELDPVALWESVRDTMLRSVSDAGLTAADIAAVGITSHRETCLIWDRSTGRPVHNAVMWLSKQTDEIVDRWSAEGLDEEFRSRTGMRNDSYYSAAKLVWLLENVEGIRADAEAGRLAAGTIDCWLLWNLTGGKTHATDPSAASRTALLDIRAATWDVEFCERLGIPVQLLPEIRPSGADFGRLDPAVLGETGAHVRAVLGDQQAAMFGQACLDLGSAKNTFGTASVLTVNTGHEPQTIHGTTSSVAWDLGDGAVYETEGVVFSSGQAISMLREKLLLGGWEDTGEIMSRVPDSGGVYFVPAFAGLCDPYWDNDVRGSLFGMTLTTEAPHIVRAAMEAMAYQTRDIVDLLTENGVAMPVLRVDGGASANDLLCQFQADLLGVPVERPTGLERTAMGIAHIAGAGAGLWRLEDIRDRWHLDRIFEPQMSEGEREERYDGWKRAVAAAQAFTQKR